MFANRTMDGQTEQRAGQPYAPRSSRSSCLFRSSCLSRSSCSSCTRYARHTRIAFALPCIACIACITRPAACCVSCMPFPTARQENAEKRHEVAKCQRFGAVNRPKIMEIMFSQSVSCCVSACNVLINRKMVKWLDKRPFCRVRVWRSC